MKIAIVDDEEKIRMTLKEIVQNLGMENHISIECDLFADGFAFLSSAGKTRYEIVFLDIFMEQIDGIKTAELLRDRDITCLVVFLTSSAEHRPDAFFVHAFDYLEKPLCESSIRRVLNDALKMFLPKQPYIDLPVGKLTVPVLYADILYVTSDSNYIIVCAGKDYRCRMSFGSLTSVLSLDSRFLLINRGILVNLDHVLQMENMICLMDDGASFPLNKKKENTLKQAYITRQFERRTQKISKEQ